MPDELNNIHLEYYRQMLSIRRFEEKIAWLFANNMVSGTCHFCVGQEACAVGAIAALEPNDLAVSSHRGHGHVLAKGADPRLLMAELMGKGTGYCQGKGGSQHLCAIDIGFLGTNGITGGGIPIATGAGLSAKLLVTGQVIICFFGDGASNQGTFHESLNMAAIWRLPVVYFCENNQYAMSMHVSRSMVIEDIAVRSGSYGIPGKTVDGMDLQAVKQAVSRAVERARSGAGPTLVEAKTYRFLGHSKGDRRVYRSREEEDGWQQRDPIDKWRDILINAGTSPDSLDTIDREVAQQIEDAAEFARNSDHAPAEQALEGVYA